MKKVITAAGILTVLALTLSLWLLQDQSIAAQGNILDRVKLFPREIASGPLRHNAGDSPYFTDSKGKAVYLTGSHVWNNLQDIDPPLKNNADGKMEEPEPGRTARFDFAEYLRFLEKENHNFIRLWTWEEAAGFPWLATKSTITPLSYARSGPGAALDGKPKFNLTDFNQEYFDRLRSRVIAAGEHGMYVSVMLFQGFSIGLRGDSGKNPWDTHPFNRANNVNDVNGDPNGDGEGIEAQTLQIPKVTALQESYVRKTVETLNDLDNVLWEICNESDSTSNEWQYHMIRFIKQCEAEKPKQHPVGMTFCPRGGQNSDLFNSPADWISPQSSKQEDYRENPPANNDRKVIIADTDHLWGVGGDRAWVWKSFTRGLNPIFMDPTDVPRWEPVRQTMGMTLAYANRMNLSAMKPHGELVSTGYCLANPGEEYLAYAPLEEPWIESRSFFHRLQKPIRKLRRLFPSKITLDLTSHPQKFRVEWLNPSTGEIKIDRPIEGGARLTLAAPFRGDVVLYVLKKS